MTAQRLAEMIHVRAVLRKPTALRSSIKIAAGNNMENISQKERFKLIPSVYALIIKEDKILLSRRFQTGYEDGKYGLVSGHADGRETMKNAMIREAREEAGIEISSENLELVLTMHRWCGDHERIDLFFIIKSWVGEERNIEPEKCDDLSWFPIGKLPENTILYIRKAINCYQNKENYCEFGWNE